MLISGGGAVLAGVGALAFIVVGTRSLGLEAFAPVSQLWTVWAIAYSVVTFSVQQTTIRAIATSGSIPWRSVMLPAFVMVLVAGPIMFIGRERLFDSQALAWPLAGSLIPIGSLFTGVARGRLAAASDVRGLAAAVGGENLVRAILALIISALGLGGAWYAGAILAGFLVAIVGFWASPVPLAAVQADGVAGSGHARMGVASSVAGLCSHGILVVAPAVLALSSVPAATVSAVFVVLAVYRSPYQLILGLAPSLSNALIRHVPAVPRPARRRMALRFAGAGVGATLVAAVVSTAIGERIVAPLFAAQGVLRPIDHGLAASLTMLAVVSISFTLALVALNDSSTLLIAWPIAASIGLGAIVVGDLGPTAALTSLVIAEVSVAGMLFASVWFRQATKPQSPTPNASLHEAS